MTSRTGLLITLTVACHLLLAHSLVTSQLLASNHQQNSPPILPHIPSPLQQEDVTIKAVEQEKVGPVFKLHKRAEIHYGTYVLRADEVTYNSETGDSTEDGNVVLDGGPNDEHLLATHGTYNIRSESGRFEDVVGTTGFRLKSSRLILTSPSPFAFTGKVVVKTGPDHYLVYDGTITTCELPNPKWQFYARKMVVEVGGNAKIYTSTFRLEGLPIFFFPFATHPIQRLPRQSGFLIPNIGNSSIKGYTLGESFFWAINRSMDALIGSEYFSKRGWAPDGEFRARPSDTSFVDLNFFSVLDRRSVANYQGGADVRLDGEGTFAGNFRAVANIDYLSSYVFRLAFSDVFTQAVNSEVKSFAFLSNATNGFFYDASTRRYQDYETDTTPSKVINILHAPSLESASVDHPIGHSPFYWSYDAAADGLSRGDPALNGEPAFRTAPLVGRFDLYPSLSLPLVLHGWSIRPEFSLRDTLYTQQLIPSAVSEVGTAKSSVITRKILEGSVDIRPPSISRTFEREFMGRKWKHVAEPRVVYNYVTGVSNFAKILRFDERDIVSDTNEVEYSVVNRLYSKRTSAQSDDCGPPGMPLLAVGGAQTPNRIPWERRLPPKGPRCSPQSAAREVVTWELAQKYFIDPTFGGALVPTRVNVFSTTEDLTGIAFLTKSRRLSPLISRLRIQTSARTDVEWDLDYDFWSGRVNSSMAFLNYRIGPFTLGGGDAFLHVPEPTLPSAPSSVATAATLAPTFNQFRVILGYGSQGKRGFSGAANVGYDATLGFLQYGSLQAAYNWDCCGFSIEYRRFALGSVRNENQYRFTFALANIGAFGNLRQQERLF
jgi:LPS-assembly protein